MRRLITYGKIASVFAKIGQRGFSLHIKRKIQKIKSISEFHKPPIKPATPVREPRRHPTSVRPTPSNEKANDLSVLDILSENRKKSRNRIR